MLCECGVTHIGFPLRLSYHREDLTDRQVREIVQALPRNVAKVLITYLRPPEEIAKLADYIGADTVQLHATPTAETLRQLRSISPGLQIIRSLIVGASDPAMLASEALSQADLVDFFLTDSYDPTTGASGATGKAHDWKISQFLCSHVGRPLILAGGLNPRNVRQAIREVGPAGVDAHTGVESPNGCKDPQLVEAFVREARLGFSGGSLGKRLIDPMSKRSSKKATAWDEVYALVREVPRGRVTTYGQISGLLEGRLSARAVGWAMHVCPADVPWHRVVNSQGGYSAERLPHVPEGLQKALLAAEGVSFKTDGHVDLKACRWRKKQGTEGT